MALRGRTSNKFDSAINVRVKRFSETYFITCDEFEKVATLKARILVLLDQIEFKMPKQEEPLTVDDLRLTIKKRVSNRPNRRFWTPSRRATTSKCSTTQKFIA